MFRIKVFGLDIYGCREALERLDDYVDAELAGDETGKVSQHLKLCHECARKFRFEQDLIEGLRAKTAQVEARPSAEVNALKSRIADLLKAEKARGEGEESV